ncbi:hypothetical protein NKG94_31425 [Micromonospora sp. M12]
MWVQAVFWGLTGTKSARRSRWTGLRHCGTCREFGPSFPAGLRSCGPLTWDFRRCRGPHDPGRARRQGAADPVCLTRSNADTCPQLLRVISTDEQRG